MNGETVGIVQPNLGKNKSWHVCLHMQKRYNIGDIYKTVLLVSVLKIPELCL